MTGPGDSWDGFQWGSDLWNNGEISDAKGS